MEKKTRFILANVLVLIVIIFVIFVVFLVVFEPDWKEVTFSEEYNKDITLYLDIDNDNIEDTIELYKNKEYIRINGNNYIVNKRFNEDTYRENYFIIIDLDDDGIDEIIHHTNSEDSNYNYYSIFNYKDNSFTNVCTFEIMGILPEKVLVKDKKIKFEYFLEDEPTLVEYKLK